MRTLDELWKAASGGKFGYSVQREIWLQKSRQWPKFFKAIDWVQGENNVYRWVLGRAVRGRKLCSRHAGISGPGWSNHLVHAAGFMQLATHGRAMERPPVQGPGVATRVC